MPNRRDVLVAGCGLIAACGNNSVPTRHAAEGDGDLRSSGQTILGITGQGQSNMVGELNFSQRSHPPYLFNAALDGPAVLSRPPMAFADTLAGTTYDDADIVALMDGMPPHGADDGSGRRTGSETCLYGFAFQLVRHRHSLRLCVSVAGAQGGSPLSALRRPTRAEILGGEMVATDRRIPIPARSLERVTQDRGLSLRDLWQCDETPATPWFRDALAQSTIHQLYRRRHSAYRVAYMPMQHGEARASEEYRTALHAFYDEKQACWREITGQQQDALLIMEIPNYSPFLETAGTAGYDHWRDSGFADAAAPGGLDSRYWTESDRTNLLFDRNLDQLSALRGGGRRIIASHPKYAFTSLIHHDQWGNRWAGEIMGFKAWQEDFGGQPVAAFVPTALHSVDGVARLTFDRQVALRAPHKNVASDELKPGVPYGIAVYSGAGGEHPIAMSDVWLERDGTIVAITHRLPPEAGLIVDYLRRTRAGSLCAVNPLPLVMADRDGTPTEHHDYCQPFRLSIKAQPRTR